MAPQMVPTSSSVWSYKNDGTVGHVRKCWRSKPDFGSTRFGTAVANGDVVTPSSVFATFPAHRTSVTKTELRNVASELVSDYLLGKLSGAVDESFGPEARMLLLEMLLARCPGFSTRDYRSALNVGLSAKGRGADSSDR